MNRRVFLAINLPENLQKKLAKYREKWSEVPAKWVKDFNLHITLAFLGYVRDEDLMDIIKKAEKVCARHSSFEIILSRIVYGPTDKKPAKMIWAIGEKNDMLSDLANDLEDALLSNFSQNMEKYMPKKAKKAFSSHVTLARIKQVQLSQMESDEIPEIDEEIKLCFDAYSVDIMESELKKTGPSYTILESIKLK